MRVACIKNTTMRKGFLTNTNNKKDSIGLGPLHDERSLHSRATAGWGHSDTDLNADPWVFPEYQVRGGDNNMDVPAAANHVDENPYRDIPNLPYKTSGEPMNALGCYYSQNYHTSHMKMSDYYFTWNDENPKSHLLLWTTIFICPLSGELFMSGKWPGNDVVLSKEATTVPMEDAATTAMSATFNSKENRWLKKKKNAEHGAAAWAYDCFQYRHKEDAIVHRILGSQSTSLLPKKDINITSSIGSESPYLEDMAIRTIPSYVPAITRRQIEERLFDISNDRMKYGENSTSDTHEELAWCSSKNSQVQN